MSKLEQMLFHLNAETKISAYRSEGYSDFEEEQLIRAEAMREAQMAVAEFKALVLSDVKPDARIF